MNVSVTTTLESPCIGICALDGLVCLGCGRILAIAVSVSLSVEQATAVASTVDSAVGFGLLHYLVGSAHRSFFVDDD